MSEVKVWRQRHPAKRTARASGSPAPVESMTAPLHPVQVIALAASTGGPKALAQVIRDLRGIEIPILVVQHIGAAFVEGFARWLAEATGAEVALAADGAALARECVHVVPGGAQVALVDGRLRVLRDRSLDGTSPSATALLRSVAEDCGGHCVAAVLTGMGDDGAEGLLAIRRAGGYTIAEDRSTAAVFGMPRVAFERGAAIEALPVDAIGGRIRALIAPAEASA